MTMKDKMEQKLNERFSPEHLEIVNQSHLHKGHAGDDGSGQTHFKVVISASGFDSMSRLNAHRAVCSALEEEIPNIHAISIHIK